MKYICLLLSFVSGTAFGYLIIDNENKSSSKPKIVKPVITPCVSPKLNPVISFNNENEYINKRKLIRAVWNNYGEDEAIELYKIALKDKTMASDAEFEICKHSKELDWFIEGIIEPSYKIEYPILAECFIETPKKLHMKLHRVEILLARDFSAFGGIFIDMAYIFSEEDYHVREMVYNQIMDSRSFSLIHAEDQKGLKSEISKILLSKY